MGGKNTHRFAAFCLLILWSVFLFALPSSFASAQSSAGAARIWMTWLQGGRIEDSSPTITDIDGDGLSEIIIGTTGRGGSPYLAVLEHDGSIKWQVLLDDPVFSSPAVVDLDYPPDGHPEIVVTTGGDVNQHRGSIVAFDRLGRQRWRYDTTDAQNTGTPSGNWASPTVGDVDGDGDVEIIVGSWDRNIYMLDHEGHYVWHYHVADSVWSTASLADLDHDGDLEIIVGTDITGGGILPDGYRPTDGGFVLILDKDGKLLARRQMNEAIYSSPAVGDVDLDGNLEIFVGTGMYWYGRGNYDQPYVYGFSVDTSGDAWEIKDLPGWPRPVAYAGMSSPALADLDGDGDLEIIIGTGFDGLSEPGACSANASDPDCHGALYAWYYDGRTLPGFPMWPMESMGKNAFIRSSPVVADVDGDGQQEIVFAMAWDVIVVGPSGFQEAHLHTDYSVFASPGIADLDQDGKMEIVIGGSNAYDEAHGYVFDFEFQAETRSSAAADWTMFHRDEHKTGLFPPPPMLTVDCDRTLILHDIDAPNGVEYVTCHLRNPARTLIEWQSQVQGGDGVSVLPQEGTLSGVSQDIEIAVDAKQYAPGCHDINLTIEGWSDAGTAVLGSPASVSFQLYVGEVHSTFIPLVLRN